MSDRQLTSPAKINEQANSLFLNGERQLLITTWHTLDANARPLYPDIGLNVARIRVDEGDHFMLLECLEIVQKSYQDSGNINGQVETQLVNAAYFQALGDYETAAHALQQVKALTDDAYYLAEVERMLGDLKMFSAPQEAIGHYQTAIKMLSNKSLTDMQVNTGMALTSQHLASILVSEGNFNVGGRYQMQAEAYARLTKKGDLLSLVLMNVGWSYAKLGKFDKAQQYFDEARTYVHADQHTRRARLASYKAWIAMLIGSDKAAKRELEPLFVPDLLDQTTSFQVLWARGYLHFFTYEYEAAQHDAEESLFLSNPASTQFHQAKVLLAAIQLRLNSLTDNTLSDLEAAAAHFEKKNQYIMLSWTYLILGWGYKLAGHYSEVQPALAQCIRAAKRMGHFKHLVRLYLFSFRDLHGYWEHSLQGRDFLKRAHHAAAHNYPTCLPGKHILLLGFKHPSFIFAGTSQVLKPRSGKNHAAALVFYLAQQRRATIDQIINALWTDEEQQEQGIKNLRKTLSVHINRAKSKIGFDWLRYDSSTGLYSISDKLIVYYDVYEFDRIFKKTPYLERDEDKLAEYQKGISLYYGDYLEDLHYPCFDEARAYYHCVYETMVKNAADLASKLGDVELSRRLEADLSGDLD